MPALQRRSFGVVLLGTALALVVSASATHRTSAAAAATPSGFTDQAVITGLTNPTNLRFASDGRIFVAQKNGVVKVFQNLTDTNPQTVVDLSSQVDNYWDRGLLGMALDPNFPATPNVYLLYTYDAPPGGTAPVWNDACPTPPGPNTDGCLVTGKLVRITLSGNVMTGSPTTLIQNEWCQQYPSHSIGDLVFGPDNALYVSGGDGASFTFTDYGQAGGSGGGSTVPKNPCADPPAGSGGNETPPTAEGGALRSQSFRRPSGEPVLLNGAILRVDPSTGLGLASNPNGSSSNANAKRIIAYGFRNPFRFTFKPGSNELWMGDVGWNDWEEINRIANPTASTLNFGWPCYEGNGTQPGYQSAGLNLCSSLSGGSVTSPYYTYQHGASVVSGDGCPTGNGSVVSALGFYSGTSYPSTYQGALFFGDHSRNCIWAMPLGTNGLPNPSNIQTFVTGAANPVDIESGPNGDLFYVDFDGGTIHRITYGGQQTGGNDLALSQPATSSSNDDTSRPPSSANDGNSSTRWSSDYIDNQWWQVDLGSTKTIGSVSLNWEAAYASTYKIQVSTNGTTFTDAATVTNTAPGVKTTTFTPVTGRYVRILGVTRATQWGISFWDAQVFAPAGGGTGTPVNSTPPALSGFAGQGQTLTSTTGVWSNSPSSFAYQWQRCSSAGASCAAIAGATGQAYVLAAADVGQTVRMSVTASNGSSTSQPANSAVTSVVRGDVALGMTATSSSNDDTSRGPANANDGNSATRWSSGYTDNQWWRVDLGSAKQIDTVALNWEAAYASTYKIQVSSDGTTFTDAATVTNAAAGWKIASFTAVTGRYVRVLGVTRATQYGISFWDAQVFGPGGGAGAPTAFIDTPAAPLPTYKVGDPISFTGHATDPQQGTLPASALTWTEIVHHCTTPDTCHTHNIQTFTGVASGSFNAPDHDYPSWVELQLTATDSGGLTGTTSIRLDPKTADLSFATSPSGLSLTVGSSASTAPFTRTVIQNSLNSISAPLTQTVGGTTYSFVSWSDGGAATHNITAPTTATTYTATYQVSGGGGTCSTGQYRAQYFNNMTLTGTPVLDRCESAPVNYNWGGGSPDPSVQADQFSARWTGTFSFAAGSYTFSATADDGLRVYVDGTILIDKWIDQSATTYTATRTLTAGTHTVVYEYYENAIDAVAQLSWAPTTAQNVNLSFATSPSGLALTVNGTSSTAPFSRTVAVGSSVSLSAPATQTVGGTTYSFVSWSDGGAASHSVTAPSSATTYTATYQVSGGGGSCPAGQYRAQYFSGQTLSGTPLLDRCEAAPINYAWDRAAPAPGVPADNYSVRWTGTFTFTAGSHTFSATGDDGIRAFVDGTQIINGWKDQSPTTYTATRTLTAGTHTVVVEYYENGGRATAKFSWT